MFDHHTIPRPVKECLYDSLRREWVDRFQTMTLQGKSSKGAAAAVPTESLTSTSHLQMGWALRKKCGSARFSQNVRQYLMQKFHIGQNTGQKEDPAQVAKDMRTAATVDGERMFDRTEWLSKSQIQGFFSRLCSSIKQTHQTHIDRAELEPKESGTEDTAGAEDDEDLVEEYACDVDREHLRDNGGCSGGNRPNTSNHVRYL